MITAQRPAAKKERKTSLNGRGLPTAHSPENPSHSPQPRSLHFQDAFAISIKMNFPKQPGESPFLEQAEEDVLSQPENDPVPDEADFRWPYERDPLDLVAAGLCPVWSHEHGYTGDEETMSEDLKDLMTPEMKSGPLKSLLWLAGLDDMVDAVDDPAFTITDEVLQVSMNTDIPFILRALHYAGKVPDCVMQLLYGRPTGKLNSYMQFLLAYRPHEPIPSAVTTSPTNLDLTEVFPYGQNQNCNFPLQIRCLRVNWEKNCARLSRQIEDKLNGSVNNGRQLYRGLWSCQILDSQMMYLSPVAH